MSAARTKIFGMNVSIDPKIIVAVLLVVAGLVYYSNSKSEDRPATPVSTGPVADTNVPRPVTPNPSLAKPVNRRPVNNRTSERAGLKLVTIDGSRGDVDPTLRLQLLEKVRSIAPAVGLRNLFEGANAVAQNLPPVPKGPKLPPKPIGAVTATNTAPPPPPPAPPFNIPLKYYGFAKPSGKAAMDGNRGLFLDGDNILMGGEGDVLERRYLIVALTPNSARLEDTEKKQGQDVPVTPAAQAQ